MLARLLRGTEWHEVSGYLSPTFFDVVHPLGLAKKLQRLSTDFVTRRGFADIAQQLQTALDAARFPVRLEIGPSNTERHQGDSAWGASDARSREPLSHVAHDADDPKSNFARGNLLLQLYFRQIFGFPAAVLDYRRSRFETKGDGDGVVWRPKPLFVVWDPAFIDGVRRLYRGFYEHRTAEFDQALSALGLDTAKDELVAHFGPRQEQVSFSLADFRATFHQVFLSAKRGKRRLPADFLPFGAGLACLYEHLEQLGGTFDPKAAYFAAVHQGGKDGPL